MKHHWMCSFCGVNSLGDTTIIVRGNTDEPAICSKCVAVCVEALAERKGSKMDEKCIDSKVMTGELGRNVTILVNGSILASIDTNKAVAADYLSFMRAVTQALTHTESLEREANASGKTIKHSGFSSFGSVDITETKGP